MRMALKKRPSSLADFAAYHVAVTPGMGPGTLDRVKVTWGPDTERGRRRLAELLVLGSVAYVPSELNYVGLASDGTRVLLGNPGPSTWDYLSKFPNPSDW